MHVRKWLAGCGAAISIAAVVASVGSCEAPKEPPPDEQVGVARQAATGVCDSSAGAPQACIDAIQANGGAVVNDVFKDSNGLTAQQLPVFGQLFNAWPGCPTVASAGCAGQSLMPYNCPGQYQCNSLPNTFDNGSAYLNALDRLWWQPCRLSNHDIVNGCPVWGSCVADGSPGNYLPWEGLVFDLGGPSNKVAIFAENDHGPQPCESLEYTVYLTDNPFATELIEKPAVTGVDPQKWNRAVLSTIFTKGFAEIRPPDPAGFGACGDTALYSVEEDSFAQVFSLPCGITFRYASIIAGNDGLDFAECGFDSQEAELDAVAGLTEAGTGVCPDVDNDHYVDCTCLGAPEACDCNDADPGVHPGAPEACDAPDLDCDDKPGACVAGLFCNQGICIPPCGGGETPCPIGSSCVTTDQGALCVPDDCTVGGCPAGAVCVSGICVPACEDVVCPGQLVCQDGKCVDPCQGVECVPPQLCQAGVCTTSCACFAGDAGCLGLPGTVCDKSNSGLCVLPECVGVTCEAGEHCDPETGDCQPFCGDDVVCPVGQKCVAPVGCVPVCDGVTCDTGFQCDPKSGQCIDVSCVDVFCFDNEVCQDGVCVPGETPTGAGGSAGAGGTAGAGAAPSGAGGNGAGNGADPGDEGACGCRVAGEERGPSGLAFWLSAGLAIAALRRRTRRAA